jgi:hypothetical protein
MILLMSCGHIDYPCCGCGSDFSLTCPGCGEYECICHNQMDGKNHDDEMDTELRADLHNRLIEDGLIEDDNWLDIQFEEKFEPPDMGG